MHSYYTHTCNHIHINTHAHTHTHIDNHVHTQLNICIHIHIYAYTQIPTHTHIHIHTYTTMRRNFNILLIEILNFNLDLQFKASKWLFQFLSLIFSHLFVCSYVFIYTPLLHLPLANICEVIYSSSELSSFISMYKCVDRV